MIRIDHRRRLTWCLSLVLVVSFLVTATPTNKTHSHGWELTGPLSKNGTTSIEGREMLARVVIGSASVSLFGGIFVMVSASNLFSSNVEIDDIDLQISQIVFCLAITDMIFSINVLVEGVMTAVKGALWRDQNLAICSAQGFVNQFCMLSIVLWNLAVGVSVYRSSRSQASSSRKRQWLWVTAWGALGWGIPLITAIYGVVRDLYGPSAGWCWVVNQPSIIENAVNHWMLLYGPIFVVLCINTVLYCMLARQRKILVKSLNFNTRTHQFSSSQNVGPDSSYAPLHEESIDGSSEESFETDSVPTTRSELRASVGGGDSWRAERRQNSGIVLRLVAFIAVFILSWSGGALLYACVLLHAEINMAMLVYYCISVPLGGFFNAMVYIFLWVKAYRTWSCCSHIVQNEDLHRPLNPEVDIMFNTRSNSESFGGS